MDLVADILSKAGRSMTAFRRRNPGIRKAVPLGAVIQINRAKSYLSQYRSLYLKVHHQSRYDNLFHCCVQKTGSQWIKSMLTDARTYQYCGLGHFHYQTRLLGATDRRKLNERTFDRPFPARTITSPLYTTYENYRDIPKRGPARAFFVSRDPRDLLVSWYFSTKRNHILDGDTTRPMYRARQRLLELSERDGLLFGMEYLKERGQHDALGSWARAAQTDPDVMLIRYEDLAGSEGFDTFQRLYGFLGIPMPEPLMREMFEAYSFKRLTGRDPGTEDASSHLRSGTSGSWKQYFDDEMEARFREVSEVPLDLLGYDA